jgi:hypothetical protein
VSEARSSVGGRFAAPPQHTRPPDLGLPRRSSTRQSCRRSRGASLFTRPPEARCLSAVSRHLPHKFGPGHSGPRPHEIKQNPKRRKERAKKAGIREAHQPNSCKLAVSAADSQPRPLAEISATAKGDGRSPRGRKRNGPDRCPLTSAKRFVDACDGFRLTIACGEAASQRGTFMEQKRVLEADSAFARLPEDRRGRLLSSAHA